jgi:hypothetical protein
MHKLGAEAITTTQQTLCSTSSTEELQLGSRSGVHDTSTSINKPTGATSQRAKGCSLKQYKLRAH